METTELVAGRELDARTATALGWSNVQRVEKQWHLSTRAGGAPYTTHHWMGVPPNADEMLAVPDFSTDDATAMILVNRFWSVSMEKCDSTDPPWHVCIWARQGDDPFSEALGVTFAEAMCRAAINALA